MGKKTPAAQRARVAPNILITGTPGTGKSSLAERVASAASFEQYDVSATAKSEGLCEEYDEGLDTYVIDEDKVLDHMEERLGAECGGGWVVDYHSCDLFPERWFDLVVVLTCDNSELYERLKARGYGELKITKNVECEIFQTLVEEARDSYAEDVVRPSSSNEPSPLLRLAAAHDEHAPAPLGKSASDTAPSVVFLSFFWRVCF